MVKVNLFLRKRGKVGSTKKGRVAYPVYSILMRVSFYGKRMELSIGLHACEIQWNWESQRVKLDVDGMMPESYVNAGLDQLAIVVQQANSTSQRKGQMLTDEKVVNAVATLRTRLARTVKHNEGRGSANATKLADECAKTKRRKYFEGAYHDFMHREGDSKGWSKSSREKYTSMWNHVRKMERMKGNGFRLFFDFFREKELAEYFHFLEESEGLKNSTVKKQLEFLRRFLRWAFKHKYHTIDDFKYFYHISVSLRMSRFVLRKRYTLHPAVFVNQGKGCILHFAPHLIGLTCMLLRYLHIKQIEQQICLKSKWQIINGIFGAFKILVYLCHRKYHYYDICRTYKT